MELIKLLLIGAILFVLLGYGLIRWNDKVDNKQHIELNYKAGGKI